jgi:hypothetical protein
LQLRLRSSGRWQEREREQRGERITRSVRLAVTWRHVANMCGVRRKRYAIRPA